MRSNYAHLILLDLVIYETHRSGYNPVKNVQDFWDKYSLSAIHEHILALQSQKHNVKKKYGIDRLSTFSIDLLRTLIAYFMMHVDKADLGKVEIAMAMNMEELKMTKKISDFFQSVHSSNSKS